MSRHFNGAGDYLSAMSESSLNPSSITISVWFRPEDWSAVSYRHLCGKYDNQNNKRQYAVGKLGSSNGLIGMIISTNGTDYYGVKGTTAPGDGAWNHVVASFDETGFTGSGTSNFGIWVNGVQQALSVLVAGGSPSGGLNSSDTPLYIGRVQSQSNVPGYCDGEIAEAVIWDVVLSGGEIAMLAAGFNPLCLTHRLANLITYQDLIRPLNRPGIGPSLSATGTTVAEHPRIIVPRGMDAIGKTRELGISGPYCVDAATAWMPKASSGSIVAAGSQKGEQFSAGLSAGEVHC